MRRIDAAFVLTCVLMTMIAPTNLSAEPEAPIRLWPDGAPGEKGDIGEEKLMPAGTGWNVARLTNVTEPTITFYPAPKDKANGCCVIVAPGGGYNILAIEHEGTDVAEWFNSFGVSAVLLKYRVPRRDKDAPHVAPLQDAQRAIRLTRRNAETWGIDPDRIGILGFSAGGHLTVMTGTQYDRSSYEKVDDADELSARPDFMIPVYAAYLGDKKDPTRLSDLVRIDRKTPPTFMVVTQDDKMRGLHAALLFAELKKANVPAEVHVFTKGGHGYGLRKTGHPVAGWPGLCQQWMKSIGLLKTGQRKSSK